MHRHFGVICVVACANLLGGCRTEYLAESSVLERAEQARSRLEQAGQDQAVAVRVRLVDPKANFQPPLYVRLSALQVDKMRDDAPWRVSTRDRRAWLTGGGILLGLGLASLLGGAIVTIVNLAGPPRIHGTGDGKYDSRMVDTFLFGIPAMAGGLLETIPGAIIVGLGAKQVEVPSGDPGTVYIPAPPAPSASGALPAGSMGLRAELRF